MSTDAPALALLSPREALELLADSAASERFSPLGESRWLAVDLSRDAPLPGATTCERAHRTLHGLACPALGLAPGGACTPPARRLQAALDWVAHEEEDLRAAVTRVARRPLASAVLCQLLRGSEERDEEEGLLVESWAYATLQAGPEFSSWLAAHRARARPARAIEQGAGSVRLERSGPTLHLVLSRPARHNAFSVAMRDALVEGLRLALDDATITRVVMSGDGPSFCSGGDLDEFGSLPDAATAAAVRATRSAARLLLRLRSRTTARVHGACVGAGVELAAFAARVVASEGAVFGLPEVDLGLVPGAGGTVSLPRRIGRRRTLELALCGTRLDARRALDWGLVDEIEMERARRGDAEQGEPWRDRWPV